MLGGRKNPHDIFINLDGAIEIAAQSKKSKAVGLVKWLTKKGIEKIQEEHHYVIEEKDEKDAAVDLISNDLYKPLSMKMLGCRVKFMQKISRQKDVKILSPVLGNIMWIMQEIPEKTTS